MRYILRSYTTFPYLVQGFEEGFGDFLMELDDLSHRVLGETDQASESDLSDEEELKHAEEHDIESEDEVPDLVQLSENEGNDSEEDPQEQETDSSDAPDNLNAESSEFYRPAKGEDIYGRVTESRVYVPPAKRLGIDEVVLSLCMCTRTHHMSCIEFGIGYSFAKTNEGIDQQVFFLYCIP